MERAKTIRMVVAITVLTLLFTGQASTCFEKCYASCIQDCLAAGVFSSLCAFNCHRSCTKAGNSNGLNERTLDYAVDQCDRFNNDADKVNDCASKCEIGNCSQLSPEMAYAPISTSS
ncbi:hypothetical protein BUALT_Bualt07G0138100 [Buddleja alternifolia]|uniref:Uncharacterized protein n=1 Tax=Buddleja alternifolia TaxID=168488 RepID=A0AAV6XBJ2_9LAMI|nr:hypothetical protein BUALT_Bualt07G0138100 [Buddleja alternifolia]